MSRTPDLHRQFLPTDRSGAAASLTITDDLTVNDTANVSTLDVTTAADFTGATVTGLGPGLSAKGNLLTHNGTLTVELTPGTNGQLLQANSAVSEGIEWVTFAGGEVNTASNLGSGEGPFGTKSGVDLQFKSLVGASGLTSFSSTATEITATHDPDRCRVNRSTDQTGIVTATFTTVDFENEDFDTNSFWDAGNSDYFTIPTTGIYLIFCQITWTSTANGDRRLKMQLNPTSPGTGSNDGTDIAFEAQRGAAGSSVGQSVQYIGSLTASDVIQFYCYQNSGVNRSLDVSQGPTVCTIVRIA